MILISSCSAGKAAKPNRSAGPQQTKCTPRPHVHSVRTQIFDLPGSSTLALSELELGLGFLGANSTHSKTTFWNKTKPNLETPNTRNPRCCKAQRKRQEMCEREILSKKWGNPSEISRRWRPRCGWRVGRGPEGQQQNCGSWTEWFQVELCPAATPSLTRRERWSWRASDILDLREVTLPPWKMRICRGSETSWVQVTSPLSVSAQASWFDQAGWSLPATRFPGTTRIGWGRCAVRLGVCWGQGTHKRYLWHGISRTNIQHQPQSQSSTVNFVISQFSVK